MKIVLHNFFLYMSYDFEYHLRILCHYISFEQIGIIFIVYFIFKLHSLNYIVTPSFCFKRCKNLCVEKFLFVISPIKHWHCGEVMACPCFVCVYMEPWNNMVVINYVKPYSLPSFLTHSSNWRNEEREVWISIAYFGEEEQQYKL